MPIKRRILSVLLFWALILSLTPSALAGEGEVTVSVTLSTGLQNAPGVEVALPWDDGWFAQEPESYSHPLACAAMVLSGAAYAGRGAEVQKALEQLDFRAVQSYNYHLASQADGGRAAYTFAVKDLPEASLVALVIRGTGDVMEWTGNLNVGRGRDHAGFAQACDELLAHLEKYLDSAQLTGQPLRFLVTGHSRGGAVANLAAARLTDTLRDTDSAVYAYTFAAPTVSLDGTAEGYGNIRNIISSQDLVPQLPLAQWGYRRYGTDMPLPSRETWGAAYSGIFRGMRAQYWALTGQNYVSYRDPAAVEKMVSAIARSVPAASDATTAMVAALLQGDYEQLSALVNEDSEAALALGLAAVRLTARLGPLLSQERDGMAAAHCMASYYSWLAVWQGEGPPEEAET